MINASTAMDIFIHLYETYTASSFEHICLYETYSKKFKTVANSSSALPTISTTQSIDIIKHQIYMLVAIATDQLWFVGNQVLLFSYKWTHLSCNFCSDVIYVEQLLSPNSYLFRRTLLLPTIDIPKLWSFFMLIWFYSS